MKVKKAVRCMVIAAVLLLVLWLVILQRSRIRLARDRAFLEENGYAHFVTVGDHAVNVLTYGNEAGAHRIVAIAGFGDPDPCLSWRRMTRALEADDQVIFVDRAGYGLSDDTAQERTAAAIVDDYRAALSQAGIAPPYLLLPHSIGGIYASYWVSAYPEKKNVLTAYPFTHMNETSGTSGPMKHVPMTDRQAQIFLRYNKNYIDGLKAELLDPAWMEGRAFCTAEGRHTTLPSGITLGDASSVMADYIRGGRGTLGTMMEALFTSPVEATLPVLHTDTKYLHARFALMDRDVTGIICGFYSVAMSYLKYVADHYEMLIGDIEKGVIDPGVKLSPEVREALESRLRPMPERAAELREIFRNGSAFPFVPRVWPRMLYLTGAGGDGFSNYDRIIREKYTGGCLKNIYYGVNASEGIWSVPSGLDTEDSVMAPSAAFFEFLPVEAGDDLSKCVSMDEVEPGMTYELIVTNLCGFYRYRTSDTVLVTGFRGKTPLIRFMYRVNRTINIASEKTTEKAIQNAV
ncbi:MAG: GH3 auxin-responsive promoter family protein, partial [Oscillospiraceae bacterium]|nr:GH3 auxin-responsive promoter family protein [Oscillospiraceae bacterium]